MLHSKFPEAFRHSLHPRAATNLAACQNTYALQGYSGNVATTWSLPQSKLPHHSEIRKVGTGFQKNRA
jgi:hypothetical protein